MSLFRNIMPSDSLPKKIIRSGGFRNFETVNLNVIEWIDFLSFETLEKE